MYLLENSHKKDMSENFRSEQSVEISIKTKWWIGLIVTPIMPICLFMALITDAPYKDEQELILIISFVTIFTVVALMISLLCRKIIKRFSVDSSTRSLVFEVFCGGIRVFKKIYSFEIIDKFDIILKNMKEGKHSSFRQVEVLTLVLQSGKMKFFTGIHDQDNVKTWAMQLNNLLQNQGGFPVERFAEPLTPHWPEVDQNLLKIFPLLFILVFTLVIGIVLITLVMLGVL